MRTVGTETPVFHDPSGRRARRVHGFTAIVAVVAACWPATIVAGAGGSLSLPAVSPELAHVSSPGLSTQKHPFHRSHARAHGRGHAAPHPFAV